MYHIMTKFRHKLSKTTKFPSQDAVTIQQISSSEHWVKIIFSVFDKVKALEKILEQKQRMEMLLRSKKKFCRVFGSWFGHLLSLIRRTF
ncbi:hypothetical protein M5689_002985 [Euphorbia peplus]|nr:hypothetical protein M5689_002985 [Euphorbia peplus]